MIDVPFASWDDVKEIIISDPEIVLFDLSDLDRMLIVKTVNTYEWNDCLMALEENLDGLLGGSWVCVSSCGDYADKFTDHHKNKGK